MLHLPSNGVIAKILLHALDLYFQLHIYKICEIRLFSYVAKQLKLRQNSAKHIQIFVVERCKSHFFIRDLDLHFRFQMLKYMKIVRFGMLLKAKIMEKIQQYTLKYLHSNGVSTVSLPHDLDLYVLG